MHIQKEAHDTRGQSRVASQLCDALRDSLISGSKADVAVSWTVGRVWGVEVQQVNSSSMLGLMRITLLVPCARRSW